MFINTQTLEYSEHKEELELISAVLDCLMCDDVPRAVQALMDRQAALMESQTPKMKDYDPREAPCRC